MSDRIPQDFIDDLVQRVDIGEIIGNRIDIKKAGKEYKANCPFHGKKHRLLPSVQRKAFIIVLVVVLMEQRLVF